jgi:alpha-1,6-mannosyltransferase
MLSRRKRCVLLVLLGSALLALNLAGLHFQNQDNLVWFIVVALTQGVLYLGAVWMVLQERSEGGDLALILVFAAVLHLSLVFAPPYLSTDIYRYVWDGRVQGAGINPYRYVPDSDELADLRDSVIYPNINRADYALTVYPPVAEAILFGVTRVSESFTWMKFVMVLFEAVAVWMLIKLLVLFELPTDRVLIYAWNPLVFWEFAGSGHLDAIAIAFLAMALWARKRNRPGLVGVTLALSTLVKFYPAVIFPALYRRWDWKMPAAFAGTAILAYLPYLGAGKNVLGFLPEYLGEEGIKTGERFYLLNVLRAATEDYFDLDTSRYVPLLLAALAILGTYVLFRKTTSEFSYLQGATALGIGFSTVLSPHYPWYFTWVLPMLCFVPFWPMLVLSVCSFLLYETSFGETPEMLLRLNTLLYVPFAFLAIYYWHASRRRKLAASS